MLGKDTHNILNLIGFGGVAAAVYGGATDQNTVLAIAGGIAAACFFGAYRTMANKVSDMEGDEVHSAIWRGQDDIHDRMNKIEERIDDCVKTSVFNDTVRSLNNDIESNERDNGLAIDAIYRHIDSVSDGINRRFDATELTAACSDKRSK